MKEKQDITTIKAPKNKGEQILDAATELFAVNGFHNTSISQIAKKAGVAKGSVYNYFESKQALLEALIMSGVELGEQMMQMAKKSDNARETLKILTNIHFDLLQNDLKHWKFYMALMLQPGILESVKGILKERVAKSVKVYEDLFTALGSEQPHLAARAFFATLDGISLQVMADLEDYPLEEMKVYVLKILLDFDKEEEK